MRQLPQVETAMGRQTLALLGKFEAACTAVDDLAEASVELFEQHPDAAVIISFPGLGALSGARVLAEIGDDRSRFADAKALEAYAGSAPVWSRRRHPQSGPGGGAGLFHACSGLPSGTALQSAEAVLSE